MQTSAHSPSDAVCSICGSHGSYSEKIFLCPCCALGLALASGEDEAAAPEEAFPELIFEEPLGRGGFGKVFKATHRRLNRPVAVKLLDDLMARNAVRRQRFQQEMVAVGKLDHAGIVRAHDAGERDGHWYLITEYVPGSDCSSVARRHGRLPVAEACEIVRQAALALHHAHEQGLVHCDVKPSNLMLTDPQLGSCTVKVLDFGLSSTLSESAGGSDDAAPLGTPEYMAPEQFSATTAPTVQTDVYGLGATLRRLLTGQPPHGLAGGELSRVVYLSRLTEKPSPLSQVRPELPRVLTDLCDRLLSAEPTQRPATAAEVATALAPWCQGAQLARLLGDGPLAERPLPSWLLRHPVVKRTLIGTTALGLVAGAFFYLRPEKPTLQTALAQPQGQGQAIFSEALLAQRFLKAHEGPRLFTDDWIPDATYNTREELETACFGPEDQILCWCRWGDKRILYVNKGAELTTTKFEIPLTGQYSFLAYDHASGITLWTELNDSNFLPIDRRRADGERLTSLSFDYASDYPKGSYIYFRDRLKLAGHNVSDATPMGLCIITEKTVPEHSDLRPGDLLVADEGDRDFLVTRSRAGIWRGRVDADTPLRRLEGHGHLEPSDPKADTLRCLPLKKHFPIAVTASRSGVYLLNRNVRAPGRAENDPSHLDQRLFRCDEKGYHRCRLDSPIPDPSGLAADPLSTDLYAIDGALLPTRSGQVQRLLRLRLTSHDHYHVEVIANHFGKIGVGGLSISSDGQRLLLVDVGHRVVACLRRRQP
jgi:hypothetical protein